MKMQYIGLCAAMLALCGCVPNVSPSSYSIGAVGEVNRTVAATVISARVVHIEGSRGGGAVAGGAAGAVAGSAVGGSARANALGAIGGAVIGSIAGAAAEHAASKQEGMEYVVQTGNGAMMTVVQGLKPAFGMHQHVLVLYGSPARVIADPRYKPSE